LVEVAPDVEGVGCEIRHYFGLKNLRMIVCSAALITP